MSNERVGSETARELHDQKLGAEMAIAWVTATLNGKLPFGNFWVSEEILQQLRDASAQHDAQLVADLTARLDESRKEFAIVSRACGNWREFPEGTVSKDIPSWEHADWQAATRAILERNELRAKLADLEAKLYAIESAAKGGTPLSDETSVRVDSVELAKPHREGR